VAQQQLLSVFNTPNIYAIIQPPPAALGGVFPAYPSLFFLLTALKARLSPYLKEYIFKSAQ
jgi:hypothetical protein